MHGCSFAGTILIHILLSKCMCKVLQLYTICCSGIVCVCHNVCV